MSLVDVPPFVYPAGIGLESDGSPGATLATIDASGEQVGHLLTAPKAGVISRIGFRIGTVTTPDDLDVRVETITAAGEPSGTLWATNTNGTLAEGSVANSTWYWVPLTAGAAVARGDMFAVVVTLIFVNGNVGISQSVTNMGRGVHASGMRTSGGVWTFTTNQQPIVAVEYSDGSRPWIGTVILGSVGVPVFQYSFGSGSSPDEVGIRFTVPFRCRCTALRARMDDVGSTTFEARLYQESTLIASLTGLDSDILKGVNVSAIWHFTSPAILVPGVVYRATLLATGETALLLLGSVVDVRDDLEAWGGGVSMYATERTDLGDWTDTSTRKPIMGLVLDQLDDGLSPIQASAQFGPGIVR